MASSNDHSPGYSVGYVKGKGRALIANRSYSPGETIFTEDPLVSVQYSWNRLYGYAACDHCLRPLETMEENITRLLKYRPDQLDVLPDQDRLSEIDQSKHVMCQSGCGIRYCSMECQQRAWDTYHKLLCFSSSDESTNPILNLDALWRPMHYPPETTSIQLIVRLMATLKAAENTPKNKELLEALSSLKSDAADLQTGLMHRILREDFQSQLQTLATFLDKEFKFLEPQNDPWLVTTEWLTKVFTMIALNGQGVGGSPFNRFVINYQKENPSPETSGSVENEPGSAGGRSQIDTAIDELYSKLDDAVGLEFLNSEGTAVYALQSACNHSCDPNTKIDFPFNNATVVLVTIKSIEPGEELTISYLDECELSRSRHSRRKELMENYLFSCECTKCEQEMIEGQPDVTSEEEDSDEEVMQE